MNCSFKSLLAAVLLLCSTVATAHDFEVGGICYNITSSTEKTVEVTYKGDSYDAYYDEYTGDVTVPSTIAYHGETYSVTSIGRAAFYYCWALTSIEIPGSVTSIGEEAFSRCSGLKSVTIGNGVTSIGDYAFYDCDGLTSIEIPYSVTSIGEEAFYGCNGLTSVTIGNGVTSIGDAAFADCSGLTSIEIPGSVTSIGFGAFYSCDGLTSVTIGDRVTSIGDRAFRFCSGLTSVTSLATTAPALGSWAFDRISSNATLYYPAGSDYSSWARYFAKMEEIAVQSGSCGDNAWWRLENGVLTISGIGAMWDYSNYNNIAPWSSDEISRVVIEDGVTSIGNYAFSNCSGLTSIEIPASVTSIGVRAFRGCNGLTSIEIPGSVTSIGYEAFYYCNGLTSVIIGNGVTSIGDAAFADCSGLTSIEIPGSVTSIGVYAFYDCSGLKSVTIGDGVTSIGEYAFYYCSGLTSVTSLATTAPALGSYAFNRISSNATLYYPAGSDYSSWEQYFANIEEITEEFPEEEEVFGDLNGDGTVSVSDIQVLVNIILGN